MSMPEENKPPSLVATDIRPQSSGNSLGRQARQGRTSPLAKTIRWSVVIVALLSVGLLLRYAIWPEQDSSPNNDNSSRSVVKRKPTSRSNNPGPKLSSQRINAIEESIVKIEAIDAQGGKRLGTGFLIDASGLVATNHHVISQVTQAQVRFKDGVVYEVAGYAAVDPQTDLAILQLRDPPDNFQTLSLRAADDPPRLAEVVALGHPRGVAFSLFGGKVSQVLTTAELPKNSQQFLRQQLPAAKNCRWIQHTAVISPGNSGGPLINRRGEVVGINTWVDYQASFSYALHASHLQQLRGRLFTEPAPLERFAKREARQSAELRRMSPQRIRDLYEQAKQINWRPKDLSDYEVLQRLAWAVTYAKITDHLESLGPDEKKLKEEVILAADEIQVKIEKAKWDAFGLITLVNEQAQQQINRPGSGAFFFATVERVVEGDDGSRGALMKLAGFDTVVFVSLDGVLFNPAPQTHCLVLGINLEGRTVQWGENPLRLSKAIVITSRTIVPLEK